MDVSFLRCLRLAEERLRPAVASRVDPGGFRRGLRRSLFSLRPLAEIPLSLSRTTKFYLPDWPRPNSKAAAVVKELVESTLPADALWYHRDSTDAIWRQGGRLLWRLPLYLPLLLRSQRPGTRLDRIGKRILMGWVVRRRLLKRHPGVAPIIISDLSPGLHMLWSAALREGNPVLWWQDDYHHARPLPQPVTAAAVLNEGGWNAVAGSCPSGVLIVRRPSRGISRIRPFPKRLLVGLATNASFGRVNSDFAILEEIRNKLDVSRLHLRLHPNSSLSQNDFDDAQIWVAPLDETIAEFAQRVDLGIVGNSAVQLKLLCEGLPVVHLGGLDQSNFDTYGYVKQGLLPGFRAVDDLSLKKIRDTYASWASTAILRELVEPPESRELAALSSLKRTLARSADIPGS